MEHHFNINTTATHYVQHFYIALSNFETHMKEERKRKRLQKDNRTKK